MDRTRIQFKNREDAGHQLAELLKDYAQEDVVIYALPRGGVVIGFEVAKTLKAPLDILAVRKVGHPDSPEYAIAAVSQSGHVIKDEEAVKSIDNKKFDELVEKEMVEAKRRRRLYLAGIKAREIKGKTAIIVDDGLATGLTARAAILDLRERGPKKIVLAVPVAPDISQTAVSQEVDEFVCLRQESDLGAVGLYYDEFSQVSDDTVVKLLQEANKNFP